MFDLAKEGSFLNFFALLRVLLFACLASRILCKDVSRWMSSIPSMYGVGPMAHLVLLVMLE